MKFHFVLIDNYFNIIKSWESLKIKQEKYWFILENSSKISIFNNNFKSLFDWINKIEPFKYWYNFYRFDRFKEKLRRIHLNEKFEKNFEEQIKSTKYFNFDSKDFKIKKNPAWYTLSDNNLSEPCKKYFLNDMKTQVLNFKNIPNTKDVAYKKQDKNWYVINSNGEECLYVKNNKENNRVFDSDSISIQHENEKKYIPKNKISNKDFRAYLLKQKWFSLKEKKVNDLDLIIRVKENITRIYPSNFNKVLFEEISDSKYKSTKLLNIEDSNLIKFDEIYKKYEIDTRNQYLLTFKDPDGTIQEYFVNKDFKNKVNLKSLINSEKERLKHKELQVRAAWRSIINQSNNNINTTRIFIDNSSIF